MSIEAMLDVSFGDDTSYPNLGFNPAPGLPQDVQELEQSLAKTTDSMQEAGKLLGQMRDAGSGVWVGDAADAFRQHFNDKLVTDLEHAQQSLTEATGTIQNWYKDLTGFTQTAKKLDQEAAAAREALAQAKQEVSQARSNPNLQLAGQQFTSQQALEDAQNALDTAESAVNDANQAEQEAQDELNAILKRAQELEQQCEAAARTYASQLDNATKGLAPHKPGFFSSLAHAFTGAFKAVGNWIEAHAATIHSILSTISGIAGLIALCTPPPIDAIAGGIAMAAGAGAFAMDLANPKTRAALGGLLSGNFSKANLEAAAGTGLDALSALPGVGELKYLGKAGKLAEDAADGAKTIPELAGKVPGLAKLGESTAEGFADLGKDGSKLAQVISINAHSLSLPVTIGVGVANGVGKLSKVVGLSEDAFKVSDALKANLELGWKARGVASSLYSDVKKAI
jgi:hypothetical protein